MAFNIQSTTGRKALAPRREPYWSRLSTGLYIGFRKLAEGDGTWIARCRQDDGKQKYQALGACEDYDKAAQAAQAWAAKLERGVEDFAGTVEAACKAYVTFLELHKGDKAKRDAEGRFKRLVYDKPFGRLKLDRLKPLQVRSWLNEQVPDEDDQDDRELLRKAKDSANRNLNTLKAALNLALKDRLVDTDAGWRTVTRFPAVGKRRDRFLDRKERNAIIEAGQKDVADLIRGLLLTLARPGELAGAKVADFDPRQGTLRLCGKTGERVVTLSTAASTFFKQQARDKLPGAPLLARADGKHWTKETWKERYKEAVAAAQMPGELVMYHMRHAAISEAIMGGMDSFVVAKLAGTSTAMIDKHYGHLRHDVTRARLDALQVL